MTNKETLRNKMKEYNDTSIELAAYLGCTPVSLSNKMNDKAMWNSEELIMIYERYNWTPAEFISTFISTKIPNIALLLPVERQIIEYTV